MMASKRRVLSIDVECFASGYGHDERVPCSVAVVDEQCQIIFSSLIKAEKIVSDLFPFSGLRKTDIDQAPTYEEVIRQVHKLFDQNTVIVGQNPINDVNWMNLQRGTHYSELIDLSEWFKSYNPRYRNTSYFSLAHEALVLLGIDLNAQNGHLATQDAAASMKLYLEYRDRPSELVGARARLLNRPPRMTPAKLYNYAYEGVCLAGFFPKMCTCGRKPISKRT